MTHRSANSCSPNYDTFNNIYGALRLANRITADIDFLRSLQENYDIGEGSSFNSLSIDLEVEHHFSQRRTIQNTF